jgi:glycosyltransferase involved in cell wall biosynthesis
MAEPALCVLLLTGRLDGHDEIGSVRALLDRLARRGIAASVLCVSRGDGGTADDRVIECAALGQRWQRALAVRRLRMGESLRRPELLHVLQAAMAPAGLAIAEHWGLPYVQSVDEFLGPGERLRLSRRWCRRLVAQSRDLADDLAAHFAVPEQLLSVVCGGIEPLEEPADPCGPGRGPVRVIGTAGPLVASSGFATFLHAARRVLDAGVDAEFVIAGRGEDEVDLRRRADRLRIADRVTFASHSLEGLRFWGVLDLYCQPSIVPTVGRSLAMAMAAGVPAIASDVGGLRALIDHDRTGLRVTPDNSAALAEAVLVLLGDPQRARALGRLGREGILRDFHPDDEARALDAVYRSVLAPEGLAQPRTGAEPLPVA